MKVRTYFKSFVIAGAVAIVASGCAAAGPQGSGGSDANPYGLITPGVILSAVSVDQPYFATADKSGKPEGFIIDLDAEVAKRLGLTIEYKVTQTAGQIPGLTSGQYDMVSNGYGVTDKREESVNFSQAIYWDTISLLTQKNSTMDSMESMSEKKIAVITGAIQVDYLNDYATAIPVLFPGSNEAVSALNSGTVEGFVGSGGSMKPYLDQFPDLKIAYSEPVDHATSVMFQKSNVALTDAYNAQLKAMSADGTFKKLYDKYFANLPVPSSLVEIYPEFAE